MSIVDIFISSRGSKSHILAREGVEVLLKALLRADHSGIQGRVFSSEAQKHGDHDTQFFPASRKRHNNEELFSPFPRAYVCPSC